MAPKRNINNAALRDVPPMLRGKEEFVSTHGAKVKCCSHDEGGCTSNAAKKGGLCTGIDSSS